MSTIKVNYKSDLPPMSVELTLGGEVQQIPAHDFVLRFFTVYPHRHYDCVFEDGVWENMEKVDDTHLNVYITNHGLGVGQLHCLYISKAPYEGYNPAYYTTYSLTGMDVELIDGNGDATDGIDAEIAIDIEGVLADCRAATASALELNELMEPIYNRLKDIFPENYYTKTQSDSMLAGKQDKLTAGHNINIRGNVISAVGEGGALIVTITETTNNDVTTYSVDKTFAEVDAALIAGQMVRYCDGVTYYDVALHIPTMSIVVAATTGTTNERFTHSNDNSITYTKNKLQAELVSGTNIKTINNTSLLGSGNIDINGVELFEEDGNGKHRVTWIPGTGSEQGQWALDMEVISPKEGVLYVNVTTYEMLCYMGGNYVPVTSDITIDSTPTANSTNAVQSGGVYTALSGKQDALVSGTNIKTVNGNSLLGSGGITISGITSITTQQDGTVVITVASGDSYTINLNHIHDGLIATGEVDRIKFHVCEDETEYTGIATKDANTLYLIPESSS